jgi:hypothetical protein
LCGNADGRRYPQIANPRAAVHSAIVTFISIPLCIPGELVHGPIGLLSSYVGKKLAEGFDDQQAHYKVCVWEEEVTG